MLIASISDNFIYWWYYMCYCTQFLRFVTFGILWVFFIFIFLVQLKTYFIILKKNGKHLTYWDHSCTIISFNGWKNLSYKYDFVIRNKTQHSWFSWHIQHSNNKVYKVAFTFNQVCFQSHVHEEQTTSLGSKSGEQIKPTKLVSIVIVDWEKEQQTQKWDATWFSRNILLVTKTTVNLRLEFGLILWNIVVHCIILA